MNLTNFKNLITRVMRDQFVSATFWVFLSTGFMNFGNYVYHLLMGRMLGLSLYGALESMISVLYILSVPTQALNLVIIKFVSSHKGRGEIEHIRSLYSYLFEKVLIYGSISLTVLLLVSPFIKSFLHLPSLLLTIMLPLSFFLNLFYFLNKSAVQGMSYFFKFSVINFVETIAKVGLAILLVYYGLRVEGAYGAIIASIIVGLVVSFVYVKKIIKTRTEHAREYLEKKNLIKFILPTFITTLALMSIFTSDVILVRHFFPGNESGYYSALSVLGKIIYFASAPIVLVLFPMVSEHHSKGQNYTKLLVLGSVVTILISLAITLIYFLIPNFMILTLFGERYLRASNLLGIFGIFISLHALCSLFANFYLSIHKTAISLAVLVFAVIQIFLIFLFHQNLTQVIWLSILTTFLLLITLLLYYPHAKSS